eukprot:GHVS01007717.1.p1 GENE.GHVS01007717.1~~GHVS01007717.1.p1  ORF type:complete len:378 (+),score=21.96 GHVS01007717.1:331-1464(+)
MAASLYYVFLLCLLAWTSAKAAEDVLGGRPRRNLLFDSSSSSVGHSSSEGTSSSGESQTSSSSAEGCCSGHKVDCASYHVDYVCGSNGVSYGSYCALLNEQARDESIFMVYPGKCDEKGTCSYMCPNLFIPEFNCGSDGLTYSSLCDLQQKGCEDQTINRLLHPGTCNKCVRGCPEVLDYVCGSDGTSYMNMCMLEKQACDTHTQVMPVHKGECYDSTPMVRGDCDAYYDKPLCGSDGRTYSNSCMLEKSKCKSSKLFSVYRGKCRGEGSCLLSCPRLLRRDWVCGSDGNSYSSPCELEQASCSQGFEIIKLYSGICGECSNICITLWEPICASDGKTYQNKCELNYANCKLLSNHGCGNSRSDRCKPLYIVSDGQC